MDNYLVFTLGEILADGNTTGTCMNWAGEDAKNWDCVFAGASNPDTGKPVDLTQFYRQIPKGESTWLRNYSDGTITFTDADGNKTSCTLVPKGTYQMPNVPPIPLTLESEAFKFNLKGTEDWNTDYYGKKNGSKEAATANAARVSEQLQDEGIVMLKNNGALPLDRTQDKQKKVSAFGWSFSYPVYGGTGSNKLDPTDFVTPEQGLEAAGFEVNSELTAAYTEWADTATYKGITGTMDAVMGKLSDITANARSEERHQTP